MNRSFYWAFLFAAGLILCCAIGSRDSSRAASLSAADPDSDRYAADVVAQLKDVNKNLKEINSLLHSGTLKVVVVINPNVR